MHDPQTRRCIGALHLDDVTNDELVARLVQAATSPSEPVLCVALHVTALNEAMSNSAFRRMINEADFLYADGVSVQILARRRGLRRSQRIATTDLLPKLLVGVRVVIGRPVRLAIVGGAAGVATRAAENLAEEYDVDVVYVEHGFHEVENPVVAALAVTAPEVVLVGMGMPRELEWLTCHRRDLPPAVYVTCGGLLRLLAGIESRAPRIVQRLRLEWAYRWVRSPRTVGHRYSVGLRSLFRAIVSPLECEL